jgi:alpha-amylase
VFDLGKENEYYSHKNEEVMKKVAHKSYRPMLNLLSKLSDEEPDFRFTFSVTGVAIEQMQLFSPDILESLKDLSQNENVEFLGETYYHSLSSLYSPTEFLTQVWKHKNLMQDLFGRTPRVFRNTELIYTNKVAKMVMDMGFKGMLAEGADKILNGRRPSRVYKSPCGLPLLLKHYKLSDDIAFRFSESARSSQPLTADTFCHWINSSFSDNETINLFMDFETFGEHQWEDTGIFDFFYHFVKLLILSGSEFETVSSALSKDEPIDFFDSMSPVSWADVDRDITAWRGNDLQVDGLNKIYELESKVLKSNNESLINDWRNMQTSDHFYYMCTKWANDGDVHAYFSPYGSPHNAYTNFSHALADLNLRITKINNG